MTQKHIQIAHVKIQNILGITELEFSPEGFNEITGRNGEGKTSVLEAIKSVIAGGHDATLLRNGAEKGEVVLVLDDGTELKKRITPKTSPLDVTRDGKKLTKPTELIKDLTDMLSVNPLDFLRAPKKDRVRVLLESMPLVADAAELTRISKIPVADQPDTHALQVIEAVRKQVFDDRTGTNRAVKEKDNTINQLRLALPDAPAGVTGSEEELIEKIRAADEIKEAELQRIRDKLDGIKKANQTKIEEIRAATQAKIDAIKAEGLAEVEAVQASERDIEGKAGMQREKALQVHTTTVAPIGQALSVIRADRANAAKREQALDTIKTLEKELEDLNADAATQTQALTDIETYKMKLLSELPIPGVEIIDGDIYRSGVHFDRLNTAQQVDIAVELAKLRAGELGIICVDGLELLDADTFESFRERALQSGLQLFVTRVSTENFGVRTSNASE